MVFDKNKLIEVLKTPTAPYREDLVSLLFQKYCSQNKVPYFIDPIGNLVLGVASKKEYLKRLQKKTKDPIRLFMAHMDHPGFHVKNVDKKGNLMAQWFGGAPQKDLIGAKVWLSNLEGEVFFGKILKAELSDYSISNLWIRPEKQMSHATDWFGGFAFRSFCWEKNKILYTKAADDLIGAFSIFTLAQKCKHPSFLGLLTRAEEVGFIGAIGHLNLGWLEKRKRPVLAISLETSRTLPGAWVGKGPIVRLGDRATPFNPEGIEVLQQIAHKVLPKKHQRRIMDGGTCEATASLAFGIPSIGISVPLGNYHNQNFEGGPDSRKPKGPAPEFVHLEDIKGMLKLCEGLLDKKAVFKDPWQSKRKRFIQLFQGAQTLLRN